MKTYELTYIISSEITNEEAQAYAREVDSFIQGKEGIIIKSENPVAKTLSFPIKKIGSGYFTISEFQAEPDKIKDIEEKLEKDGKILRHMVTIKKPFKIQKERRTRKEPLFSATAEPEKSKTPAEETPAETEEQKEEKKPAKKVELEEIDKKLDEILGE